MSLRSRLPLILSVTLVSAACSHVPRVSRGDTTAGQPLAVMLDPDTSEWSPTLKPTAQSRFPAASTDGTTIVDLVNDKEDFSGKPVATVIFWTKRGKVASFRLSSRFRDDEPAEQAQDEAKIVARVNARLASHRWLPLLCAEAHLNEADGSNLTYELDGVVFPIEELRGRFDSPGIARGLDEGDDTRPAERTKPGTGCGWVDRIKKGFGSRELGFAVFLPHGMLGGDNCAGRLSADLAAVVPLR